MINLTELIQKARKDRDPVALNAYVNLKAKEQAILTSKDTKAYDDAAQMAMISKQARFLEDLISQYSEAHRDVLVAETKGELEVVKSLLPEPVTAEELIDFIHTDEYFQKYQVNNVATVTFQDGSTFDPSIWAIPKKEMGAAIKYLKSKFPTADGKLISTIIKNFVI